jgi:hypothetical protein
MFLFYRWLLFALTGAKPMETFANGPKSVEEGFAVGFTLLGSMLLGFFALAHFGREGRA